MKFNSFPEISQISEIFLLTGFFSLSKGIIGYAPLNLTLKIKSEKNPRILRLNSKGTFLTTLGPAWSFPKIKLSGFSGYIDHNERT